MFCIENALKNFSDFYCIFVCFSAFFMDFADFFCHKQIKVSIKLFLNVATQQNLLRKNFARSDWLNSSANFFLLSNTKYIQKLNESNQHYIFGCLMQENLFPNAPSTCPQSRENNRLNGQVTTIIWLNCTVYLNPSVN